MARHVALWWVACLPSAIAVRRQPQAPPSFLQRFVFAPENGTGSTPNSKVENLNVSSKQKDAVLKKVSRAWKENVTGKADQPGLPGLFASVHQRCDALSMYPSKPEVCTQGGEWNKTNLIDGLNYYVHMWNAYRKRFSHLCCTGVNHLFAVFFMAGTLQPPAIIQAGVTSGQMTWWLRRAVPDAQIFALERINPMMVYSALTDVWVDQSGKTKYFVGRQFVDVIDMPWESVIPDPGVRAKTLVILSDHRSCMVQFKVLQKQGFRKFLYLDNYPYEISTSNDKETCKDVSLTARDWDIKHLYGDSYTPNAICGKPLDENTQYVLYKDMAGRSCKKMPASEHQANVAWMQTNAQKYYEFPPVFTTCPDRWKMDVSRQQLLHEVEFPVHLFPQPEYEVLKYGHLYPAYVELVHVPQPGQTGDPDQNQTEIHNEPFPEPPGVKLEPIEKDVEEAIKKAGKKHGP